MVALDAASSVPELERALLHPLRPSRLLYYAGSGLFSLLGGVATFYASTRLFSFQADMSGLASLIVALFMATLALQIEQIARIRSSSHRIAATLDMVRLLLEFPELAAPFLRVLDAMRHFRSRNLEVFHQHTSRRLVHLSEDLDRMTTGELLDVEPYTVQPTFASHLFGSANGEILALSFNEKEAWWDTSYGRVYYAHNVEAVQKRGVRITRIFIVNAMSDLEALRDLANQMTADKMLVKYALKSRIPSNCFTYNLIIYDNVSGSRYVTWWSSTPQNVIERWNISTRPSRLDEARHVYALVAAVAEAFPPASATPPAPPAAATPPPPSAATAP